MDYNKDDILLLKDNKSRIAKARKLVDDASKDNLNIASDYANVCNMLGLNINEYKSIQGKVYVIKGFKDAEPNKLTREKFIHIAIGDKIFKNTYEIKVESFISNHFDDNITAYIVDNTILIAFNSFAFRMDTFTASMIGYFIKGNTNTDLTVQQINNLFSIDKLKLIGELNSYNKETSAHIISYNNKIYKVKFLMYIVNTKNYLLLLDNEQIFYVDINKNMFYKITIQNNTEKIYTYLFHNVNEARIINNNLIENMYMLIDTVTQKIYAVKRGLWDSKIIRDRYILNVNTEYIGVIVESTCAIYDIKENKCYYADDTEKTFLTLDKEELKDYYLIAGGSGEEPEKDEFSYSYEEISKDMFMTSLESSKI